jgi:pimeloyl-ACP methyl ester carboxylesterase
VRYVVVPDAAHNVMIDNHGGFAEAVAPALG